MAGNPDLVIRGGNIADGLGGELFEADVAISGGRIAEVGRVSSQGKEEIDARGKLVTPGFVDVHTHYDGQVTWSQDITPSSQNGVTTAIMGNCGVGFAPCRPSDHVRLIQLMEGVEDIPEPVLSAGIPWAWESFPDYMEWLSKRQFDVDIGAQLPHAALRVYVMGERGANRDPSTPEDNKAMAALGGRRGARRRAGLFDLAHPEPPHLDRRLHPDAESRRGRTDRDRRRDAWRRPQRAAIRARSVDHQRRPADDAAGGREYQDARFRSRSRRTTRRRSAGARRSTASTMLRPAGLSITAQIAARPVGLMLGLELSRNPFQTHPSYQAIAHLPLAERLKRLHQPEVRAAILSEHATSTDDPLFFRPNYDKMYLLGDPPDYEQPPENTLGAQARRQGRAAGRAGL